MAMKKVNCDLVRHLKEKLLFRVVFSLGLHVESNLNAMYIAMTQRHSLPYTRRINSARGLRSSKSYTSVLAQYTMLVWLAMSSDHISIKFVEVEV